MLELLTSVPAVAGVALAAAALAILDMIDGERLRTTDQLPLRATPSRNIADLRSGRARRRAYALVCSTVLLVLVALRFVVLAL